MKNEIRKNLNHNVRNPLAGIVLEIKRIRASIIKIEEHLDRVDKATSMAMNRWAVECQNPGELRDE